MGNLVLALQACWKLGASLETLSTIHSLVFKTGASTHLPVQNSLLTGYAKFLDLVSARHLFDEIPQPDVVSRTALIGGYAQYGDPEAALRCFKETAASGYEPDGLTLVSVLRACGRMENSGFVGEMIHAYAVRRGFSFLDIFLGNSLIDVYSKNRDLGSARSVFAEMPVKNLVTWNSLLSGLVRSELHAEALSLYYSMARAGVDGDEITLVNLLQACRSSIKCRSIHGVVIRRCWHFSNVVLTNTILQAYSDCRLVGPAYQLFRVMGEKNLVSWSTMMMAFCCYGLPDKSISLFSEMVLTGLRPNSVVMLSLVQAGSVLAELNLLRTIHGVVLRNGLAGEVYAGTALLDGYAKCGEIKSSDRVFRSLTEKNVVSWSAMIGALGINGQPEAALAMFREMEEHGVHPNEITILSLLSACSHGGMVEQGLSIFSHAFAKYSLSPSPEHYSCMADMLARAGDVSHAFDIATRLPSAGAWGSLLSACRSYGDCELGEMALSRLTELEDSPGAYILASNMYAMGGLKGDSARMRMTVKEKGMQVAPGFSSVRVDTKLHRFIAGDESHPRKLEILFILRHLHLSMKSKKTDTGEIEYGMM